MPIIETPFRKGFETQTEQVNIPNLTVQEGSIPAWLNGTYVRNGPGQFEVANARYFHWFDGLAMPHRYKFENGSVGFANRYLMTKTYKKDTQTGKLNYRMSATDPERTWLQKFFAPVVMEFTDNTNIHTLEMSGEYVAVTERQEAWTFDLDTLETKGLFKYKKKANNITQTAHTHYDPATRIKYNLMLSYGVSSAYKLYTLKDRKYNLLSSIPISAPSYMHSFSMTANYIILAQYPFKLSRWGAFQFLFTPTPYLDNFAWRPQDGTILTVIDRASGKVLKHAQTEAFFSFHHINAYEKNDMIFIDLSAYADGGIVQGLYLDTMKSDVEYTTMTAEYRRYRIPMNKSGKSIEIDSHDLASDDRILLPRISYNRYNGKEYRYCYGLGNFGNERDFVNQLVKVDANQGAVIKHYYVAGHYPSEPVFAPRPGATNEDDGVVMSTVYNSETEKSYMLLLDGQTFDVQAKADLPIRIPFGFHGRWYPNGNMYAL